MVLTMINNLLVLIIILLIAIPLPEKTSKKMSTSLYLKQPSFYMSMNSKFICSVICIV